MANHPSKNESSLQDSLSWHLRYSLGQRWEEKKEKDIFSALVLSVRDRLLDAMLETEARHSKARSKRIYYLSLEFLIGRSLSNNLRNLGIFDECRQTLAQLGTDLEDILEHEIDAALGNGGLGRLAACFLDSMATLGLPAIGYGLYYEYGLFCQKINNGYQQEEPEYWLHQAGTMQFERPDEAVVIPIYGHIEHGTDLNGEYNPMWLGWEAIIGVPHDIPIVGYGGKTVLFLRLYEARPSREFDIKIFNEGDYFRAVEKKIDSEKISKILYPSDTFEAGRELRLAQEYFLVACSLRDIFRRFQATNTDLRELPQKAAIQLNDTHPALAIPELMRILVDEQGLPWEQSWDITRKTCAYTNHTLLSEALEKWPIKLFESMLPRHLQIIYEINERFLREVSTRYPGDRDKVARMSLIEEAQKKQIRMAHLAIAGSQSVNGVSKMHTELIKQSLVPEFYDLWPERFNNKTNGITQRRWLLAANPGLSDLITETIGDSWITDLDKLGRLESLADDREFQSQFMKKKQANKNRLARFIYDSTRIRVNPDSLFDVQVKRIHEYKRQLLNVMHIIHEYLRLTEDRIQPKVPKTYIFSGKAAPGYWAAKQIIKLIHSVAHVVNSDPRTAGMISVLFLPDYRVSLAEKIIPSADLSEQISTAGKEASGTGNMKLALNGALTMGTLDGANVEIMEEVGEENIYIFGNRADQIHDMKANNAYDPRSHYHRDPETRRVLDTFRENLFCPDEPGLFGWFFTQLLDHGDPYFHLADFPSYLKAHAKASEEYARTAVWARKAILNVARTGRFSSDRTIREYAREIWGFDI